MTVVRIKQWHKTRMGLAVFALIEAALCYLFATIAIDTGSLISWTLAFFLLFGTLANGFQLLKKVVRA